MNNLICNQQFDEERALYHLQNTTIQDCRFAGPADGESALKEARNVTLHNCDFSLRYPLWHVQGFQLENCRMDELTRAAIWYSDHGRIAGSVLGGIKALRECRQIQIDNSDIHSLEFGWKCNDIQLSNSKIHAEYLFFDSRDVTLENVRMSGKYSFQYMENLTIRNSYLDTKDAFWHSKNITVTGCTLKGEYLAWFSEGLTLIDCHIIGTQPFCYCKDLKLINCTMEGTDLSFEYSDVDADIRGHVDSVKNPRSGKITLDSVGEVIMTDDVAMECTGRVHIRQG